MTKQEAFKEDRLATAIGKAVLDAIKEMQPDDRNVVAALPEYQTKKQLAENYGKSTSAIGTIIGEIREQVEKGRYDGYAVLDGCGTMVNVFVFFDYLSHRRALKDPVACQYVPPYDAAAVREAMAK